MSDDKAGDGTCYKEQSIKTLHYSKYLRIDIHLTNTGILCGITFNKGHIRKINSSFIEKYLVTYLIFKLNSSITLALRRTSISEFAWEP